MIIDIKKIKLPKINKYKMPEYNYPYTYKIMYARSELRKAIMNVEKAKVKPLSKMEALKEFCGLCLATNEEIDEYFRKKAFDSYFLEFFGYVCCFYSITSLIILMWEFKSLIIETNFLVAVLNVFFPVLVALILIRFGYGLTRWSNSTIKKGKTYVADCYEYDFKGIGTIRHRSFYIKIHDNKGKYIDEWIRVAHKPRPQSRIILYIFEYKNEIGLDVIFK